ncbi:YihY family inner membrane protein [Bordetella avium]|uniref:UPF0761 membrane protein BAV2278 n=1 Tax=Bordetella avium (strain 197N) TaxID=360910 RepID=Q2KYJ7_BORA1|nr:YihY family inner membrane protein [Bordetella avium]AZY49571.1 hypothetical protein C0J09_10805 [Bordetella avium]RIQ11963.1 YihY family inner membrane protein [Bordetella avium]RIQ17729.1 YihY family inner membrane protein [Bordetella avium]RIQ32386.1 YihY family inner membrane protein [Bordetella avium]RIQ37063.1 YihY family inner membrane protein [Bordetella avium]
MDPTADTAAGDSPPRHRSWLERLARAFRFALSRADKERLLEVASSLTFTTVLAIVPMLAVGLSLFTAFPVFQDFRLALEDFLANNLMPPEVSDNIMDYLNQFARQASRLTAIGGAFLVVTSLLLIMTIDKTFNDIWHVGRQRPWPQRALVYWAVLTLGPVATGASLWATSFVARESMGLISDVPEIVSLGISLVPLLLTGLGFSALFVVVPNCRVYWRDALTGGFCTAFALEAMKAGFALYLNRFPAYTVIYGAFATLPIFLLWIYLSWLAVLLGASIAANVPRVRLGRWEVNRAPGAQFIDAIGVLSELLAAFGQPPISTTTLAQRLELHHDELSAVLEALSRLALIAPTGDDGWVLACDPRTTELSPLYDHFLLDRQQRLLRRDPRLADLAERLAGRKNIPKLEELACLSHNSGIESQGQTRSAAAPLPENAKKIL